jgi:hypothetical protein
MHLEDEQIQRLLHGELHAQAEEAVRGHLAACAGCRLHLEEAQREEERIFDLLRRVDHAPPVVAPSVVLAETLATRPRREAVGWGRWAAGIVLALAAGGAAYAAPGSPLPEWVDRVTEWIGGPAPRPAQTVRTSPIEAGTAGVAVEPSQRFTILFQTEQAGGTAAVSLTDGANIVARALSGTATFTTYIDQLTIERGGPSADYEIELPQSAAWVEIRAGQRRLLLKEGSRITTDASVDARGRYLLPLNPPSH